MPNMVFTEKAFEEYMEWQSDKDTMKRINKLLKDISRTPFSGIGKPEPLKHGDSGKWSRRINDTDPHQGHVPEFDKGLLFQPFRNHILEPDFVCRVSHLFPFSHAL